MPHQRSLAQPVKQVPPRRSQALQEKLDLLAQQVTWEPQEKRVLPAQQVMRVLLGTQELRALLGI